MEKVERDKVPACEEQKLLMKFLRKELSKKSIVIDGEVIEETVALMERRFYKQYDFCCSIFASYPPIDFEVGVRLGRAFADTYKYS